MKRIEERRPGSADELRADPDLQDIVSLNITRAVQLCVDLAVHVLADTEQQVPQTMGDAFDSLVEAGVISAQLGKSMRGAVGFRNIAVHSYQAIDWDIVYAISREGLEHLRQFAAAISTRAGLS
ncbi:MAG TPA: DUF86 domain-containing protein [Gammaproteobacteria bacterium]|nr:DUF86 domain-containing protein [Gammaproteobacteria bacterium]